MKTKYFYPRMSIIYLLESQKLPIFSYSRNIKFSFGQCFLCSIYAIMNVYEKKLSREASAKFAPVSRTSITSKASS